MGSVVGPVGQALAARTIDEATRLRIVEERVRTREWPARCACWSPPWTRRRGSCASSSAAPGSR
jgi:hypothetical protein